MMREGEMSPPSRCAAAAAISVTMLLDMSRVTESRGVNSSPPHKRPGAEAASADAARELADLRVE
jgi:hypothetical protein